MDAIEDFLPDLTGTDFAPFGSWKTQDADDSFINAAAITISRKPFCNG